MIKSVILFVKCFYFLFLSSRLYLPTLLMPNINLSVMEDVHLSFRQAAQVLMIFIDDILIGDIRGIITRKGIDIFQTPRPGYTDHIDFVRQ